MFELDKALTQDCRLLFLRIRDAKRREIRIGEVLEPLPRAFAAGTYIDMSRQEKLLKGEEAKLRSALNHAL